jgi:hypothetical protein
VENDRWTEQALRLYRRYQTEIVEACGLCPWAMGTRLEGKVRERVLLQSDVTSVDEVVSTISELAKEKTLEIGLLIFPRITTTRSEFERFVGRIRDADSRCHELGKIPFMSAAFHPDATADTSDAERLVPFLRRTPDPTIQLVRATTLERAREGTPQGTQFMDTRTMDISVLEPAPMALRERIARTNLATVEKMGVDTLKARLDDIRRDREETYRGLLAAR